MILECGIRFALGVVGSVGKSFDTATNYETLGPSFPTYLDFIDYLH